MTADAIVLWVVIAVVAGDVVKVGVYASAREAVAAEHDFQEVLDAEHGGRGDISAFERVVQF